MDKTKKFDKVKYDNEYIKNNLDIIKFSAPKGEKDKIKQYAEQHGESISAFIRSSIRLRQWVDGNPDKIPPADEWFKKEFDSSDEQQSSKQSNSRMIQKRLKPELNYIRKNMSEFEKIRDKYICEYEETQKLFNPFDLKDKIISYLSFEHPRDYVYFITDEDCVKIGRTNNVKARLCQLQTSTHRKLRIICTMPCKSKESGIKLEKYLHTLFSKYSAESGEWFYIVDKINEKYYTYVFGSNTLIEEDKISTRDLINRIENCLHHEERDL